MKILLVMFSLFFSQSLLAQTLECNVIMITEAETYEQSFLAPFGSQGHNVPEQTYQTQNYEITAMADGKWLGLKWTTLDGKPVAESINLLKDLTTQPRVLLLYNPFEEGSQLSIDCAKKEVKTQP